MKAEIDEKGVLIVSAETALEAYAIKQWSNSQLDEVNDGVRLMNTANFILRSRIN